MATETYKYFKPDTNLRSEYGGAVIQAAGDSREIDAASCTHRYLCKKLGYPKNGATYLWQVGTASDGFKWFKVPDLFYAAVSPYLSSVELATVTATAPTGFTKISAISLLQPSANRKNIFKRGDSIGAGVNTTSNDSRDTWVAQALTLAGETLQWTIGGVADGTYTEGFSDRIKFGNLSLGSSSWDNSVPQGGNEEAYPKRESLAFAQRVQTLPVMDRNTAFLYALGTNDFAYDTTISSADGWARAVTRINAWKTENPGKKIGIETLIKRTENATLNGRLNGYNVLVRANYASMGLELFDTEALVSQFNISTGDTTNATYYNPDGIHPKTAGNMLAAVAHQTHLINWINAA